MFEYLNAEEWCTRAARDAAARARGVAAAGHADPLRRVPAAVGTRAVPRLAAADRQLAVLRAVQTAARRPARGTSR